MSTTRSRPKPLAAERGAPPSPRLRAPAKPWQVAAVVLVVYGIALGGQIRATGISSFIAIGREFVDRPQSAAHRDATISDLHAKTLTGYDGQFSYYIALAPLAARWYVDDTSYRYGRILYPAAALALAFGQPGALPYTMLGINLAAIVATVYLLAGFLRRRSLSAWWAAVYGFFPGLTVCLWFDLTEPLAFFLLAAGLVLLDRHPERALRYAPLFALAALARETTLVASAVVWLWVLLQGRVGARLSGRSVVRAAAFALIWLAPFLAYRGFLAWWVGIPTEQPFVLAPFSGLALYWPFNTDHVLVVLTVVLPGLAWLALAALSLWRARLSLPAALVLANALIFVVLLPSPVYGDYQSAGRASTPLVLAAILLLPRLLALPRRGPALALSGIALLTPLWMLAAILATGTSWP